jgi:hypothetical protein
MSEDEVNRLFLRAQEENQLRNIMKSARNGEGLLSLTDIMSIFNEVFSAEEKEFLAGRLQDDAEQEG